ncbi:TonB family protein [Pandoraea iniqua]|uniref:TonB family protein n=1 Tax=Pandoraea iniqua TaxID=2508288 RepID=A0A5E4XJC9_9BURK|nr:energy transducer TonB [Pandoraea iniqua]VVE36491.1 TonB family protein [Pandoraea iniqua]
MTTIYQSEVVGHPQAASGPLPAPALPFPQSQGRWPWRAMATALAVEAILLGLTTGWLSRGTPPPARVAAPVMLAMVAPEPEAAPAVKPVEPVVSPAKPAVPVKHVVTPKPVVSPVNKTTQPAHEATRADAPPIKTVDGADAPPAPSAGAAPTPAASPSNAAPGPDDRFIAKLRAAVQAAVVYPVALRGMGLAANIDVEFAYQDGVVSNVHVSRPGRVATLDQAAIAAVQHAAMPSPPPNLAGKLNTFKVRVIFSDA